MNDTIPVMIVFTIVGDGRFTGRNSDLLWKSDSPYHSPYPNSSRGNNVTASPYVSIYTPTKKIADFRISSIKKHPMDINYSHQERYEIIKRITGVVDFFEDFSNCPLDLTKKLLDFCWSTFTENPTDRKHDTIFKWFDIKDTVLKNVFVTSLLDKNTVFELQYDSLKFFNNYDKIIKIDGTPHRSWSKNKALSVFTTELKADGSDVDNNNQLVGMWQNSISDISSVDELKQTSIMVENYGKLIL